MTLTKTAGLWDYYRRTKVWLNSLFDRVMDLCSMFLLDVHQLPWPPAQKAAQHIARFVGDVSWLMRDWPRLSAYRLTGKEWTIVFVGGERGLLEICPLLFPDQAVEPREIARVALWQLSAQAARWRTEGVHLVVCELSRVYPWPLQARFAFTVPTWVHQALAIPTPPEQLLAGRRMHSLRHSVSLARKKGWHYRFTRSQADFDHFYHRMYVPFLRARHRSLAMVGTYQEVYQWFRRGGLILITQHDRPVAGNLCYLAGDTCYSVEGGVLDGDPELFQQRINAVIDWYTLLWGYDQGAKTLNMGGSHAWRSNGSFDYKQRWGARVVRRKALYGTWTLLADDLPPALEAHLNRIGFISELNGKFYGVWLARDAASATEFDLAQEQRRAQQAGLAGLVVISPSCAAVRESLSAAAELD